MVYYFMWKVLLYPEGMLKYTERYNGFILMPLEATDFWGD
jgi:hypothetical protein